MINNSYENINKEETWKVQKEQWQKLIYQNKLYIIKSNRSPSFHMFLLSVCGAALIFIALS